MDNSEQNKVLTAAIEGILAAREVAASAMMDALNQGQDVVFLKGRKKERKVGMVLNFNAEDNTILVKVGRSIEEVLVERLVEIVEPFGVPLDDEEDAVDMDEEEAPLPAHISREEVPELAAQFARMHSMEPEEREQFARKISGYTGPAKGPKSGRPSMPDLEPPF